MFASLKSTMLVCFTKLS